MAENEKIERIIVTVDDENLPIIESVVAALESAGMKVQQVLTITGIITGEVAQSNLEGLKSVPGVADVESDREMRAI